jgi:membrane peptidoglycan carboxypeptidase
VNNYENSYLGTIDLNDATTFSDNAVYAQLTAQVGPQNVARMASRLGITSHLNDYFAIGLGVNAVNPLEMARAFGTFANGGERIDGSLLGNRPRAVMRIVDGKRVDRNEPVERPVLGPNQNGTLTSMLENVVRSGTGKRAALGDRPAAGKTGTTENYGDAWFVGYTPQLVTAVWVGYPNKLKPMLTQFDGLPVAGGTFPALIWKTFQTKALYKLGELPEYFPAPQSQYAAPRQVVYRNNHWYIDNGNCKDSRTIMYVAGFGPTEKAPCKPNEVDVPRVVGARLEDARARLLSMPLTPEVITRPAKPGERLGLVVAQFPNRGTLSTWDTVRIVVPKTTNGRIPDVVGLSVATARHRLAARDIAGLVEAFADGKTGLVLAQYPHAGLAATPNMTVRLIVGRA